MTLCCWHVCARKGSTNTNYKEMKLCLFWNQVQFTSKEKDPSHCSSSRRPSLQIHCCQFQPWFKGVSRGLRSSFSWEEHWRKWLEFVVKFWAEFFAVQAAEDQLLLTLIEMMNGEIKEEIWVPKWTRKVGFLLDLSLHWFMRRFDQEKTAKIECCCC